MNAKQKYWLTRAHFGTVLFIGFAAMMLLVQAGEEAVGYGVGAVALVLSILVFLRIDRKAARERDGHA